jgi:hypothetical protein
LNDCKHNEPPDRSDPGATRRINHLARPSKALSKTLKSIGAFSITPAEQGGKAGILDTVRPENGGPQEP